MLPKIPKDLNTKLQNNKNTGNVSYFPGACQPLQDEVPWLHPGQGLEQQCGRTVGLGLWVKTVLSTWNVFSKLPWFISSHLKQTFASSCAFWRFCFPAREGDRAPISLPVDETASESNLFANFEMKKRFNEKPVEGEVIEPSLQKHSMSKANPPSRP